MPSRSTARRILLLVPFQARDLEGHALVAYHLRTRFGHDVRLGSVYGVERQLLEFAPDVLVIDHLMWRHKAEQARLAKKLGMRLVVLTTEGLFHDPENALRRAGKLQAVSGLVDAYLSWGTWVRDAIVAERLMPPERVHVVGGPRFDFYRDPLLALSPTRESFLARWAVSDVRAPVIVWATSTTYTGHDRDVIRRRYTERADVPRADVDRLLEDEDTQYREHTRVVLQLARRHPEWTVIVKTHPAEHLAPYAHLPQEAPNIRLAYNAPIREFVRHCDVLLQRNCTTSTEAWMFDKPVLELAMGRYHLTTRPEYLAGNQPVHSVDEAEAAIRACLDGTPIMPAQQRAREAFLRDFYFRIDGGASARCAEVIHAEVTEPAYDATAQARTAAAARVAFGAWRRREDARPANRLKDALGIPRDRSLRVWKRFRRMPDPNLGLFVSQPDVTPAIAQEMHHSLARVLGGWDDAGASAGETELCR